MTDKEIRKMLDDSKPHSVSTHVTEYFHDDKARVILWGNLFLNNGSCIMVNNLTTEAFQRLQRAQLYLMQRGKR